MKRYIESEVDYEEWKVSHLVPLPKKGYLSNPINWRGINLLDVASKIVSISINKRLQKLIQTRGVTYQIGATPKTGCPNGFCLKMLLQARREHDKDTCCVFINLVKVYDSIQHEVTSMTLKKWVSSETYVELFRIYILIFT